MLKKLISYLICATTPKALSEAVNEAASVDELDDEVIEKAGIFR